MSVKPVSCCSAVSAHLKSVVVTFIFDGKIAIMNNERFLVDKVGINIFYVLMMLFVNHEQQLMRLA